MSEQGNELVPTNQACRASDVPTALIHLSQDHQQQSGQTNGEIAEVEYAATQDSGRSALKLKRKRSKDSLDRLVHEQAKWDCAKAKIDYEKASLDCERAKLELEKVKLELGSTCREIEARDAANLNVETSADHVENNAGVRSLDHVTGKADDAGEFNQDFKEVSRLFPGIPSDEIENISLERFRPINLYKLSSSLPEGCGPIGSYKVFGSYCDDVWFQSFQKYTMILCLLHGKPDVNLRAALLLFQMKIGIISNLFEWQNVLSMAIEFHDQIKDPFDATQWTVPAMFVYRYCNPQTLLRPHHYGNLMTEQSQPGLEIENQQETICANYNSVGCTMAPCIHSHKCIKCGIADHGATQCTRAKRRRNK